MYLLDTNVLSLAAPSRRNTGAAEALAKWLVTHGDELWLSVVTAAEIEDGIAKAARTGATKKARDLAEWWGEIRHFYAGQILPIDLETARETGRLMDVARAAGIDPGFEDIAIAATGSRYGLTVLTGNEKHFGPLGIAYRNPLKALP